MNIVLEKYSNWLKINGYSKDTIANLLYKISYFLKYLKKREISEEIIGDFFLKLRETRCAGTINTYRTAVKIYLKFLKKDINIPKYLKTGKRFPKTISEEYLKDEVINVIEAVCEYPLKFKAIIYFMFYTGVRLAEIVSIKRIDIDLKNCKAKVYGKGKKERIVIFTEMVKEILENYFTTEPEGNNAFNITKTGLQASFYRLKTYFKEINFHPHTLRHGFGTHCRKKGVRLEDIKELMGHSSIQTTMIYAHANMDEIEKDYHKKIG